MTTYKYNNDYIELIKLDGRIMNIIVKRAKVEDKSVPEIIEKMIMRGLEVSGHL